MDSSLINTFLTLALSVGVIGGLMLLVKKYGKKIRSQNSTVQLEILTKLSLSPKNQLYVIKAAGRTLLIGTSEKSISAIADLSQTKEVKAADTITDKKNPQVKPALPTKQAEDLSFSAFIKSALTGKQNN